MLKEIAYLHDILEDTNTTTQELISIGISTDTINIINILTKKKDEPYTNYINRIKKNSTAQMIKKADLEDNMNISRLNQLTDKDIARIKKYHKAYTELK